MPETQDDAQIHIVSLDDEPADSKLLEWCLRRVPGWNVTMTSFSDPDEALQALPDLAADILLLDHNLGSCDSHTVMNELEKRAIDVPVVILTGAGDEQLAVDMLHSGALDYLPKPRLSSTSIRRVISNAVERHRLERSVNEYRRNLEEANADLRRRHDEIRRFYSVVSHEIKTPLTAAREFISILRDGFGADDPATRNEYFGIALESCDEMTNIVNDLSDLSRLETGKFSLNPEPFPLAQLMTGLEHFYQARAQEQGVRFSVRFADDLPVFSGDIKRLRQVVSNLLNNALKFTPEGGRISVRLERVGDDAVQIAVEDTGRGIEPSRLEHVFERFYQCEDEDTTSYESLGLGLSLAREFVELHGGEIRVESEVGKGTTFFCTFPAAVTAEAAHDVRTLEEVR